MFAANDRNSLRQRYVETWRRRRAGLPLEPVDAQIADVIELHPEYQKLLESEDSVQEQFGVEEGRTNPFLHMGLHLALREQLGTDRPAGIRAIHAKLAARRGNRHDAEHTMIEALAETLWEAQRAGRAPDELAYLERLKRLR
ncbi:MAG: DUF1841 family protein [Steroidobacteraceae bacterium]